MELILISHIGAGVAALIAALLALFTAKGARGHVLAGRLYFYAMVIIFVTALVMAVINGRVMLFFIALFSFYLAYAGWRFAKNRKGFATLSDWIAAGVILLVGVGMWGLGFWYFAMGDGQFVTMGVFGAIALGLGVQGLRTHRQQIATGKRRIALHLSHMMAGTIAVITATLVVNVDQEPVWLWWILPTIIITPAIIWWARKVQR